MNLDIFVWNVRHISAESFQRKPSTILKLIIGPSRRPQTSTAVAAAAGSVAPIGGTLLYDIVVIIENRIAPNKLIAKLKTYVDCEAVWDYAGGGVHTSENYIILHKKHLHCSGSHIVDIDKVVDRERMRTPIRTFITSSRPIRAATRPTRDAQRARADKEVDRRFKAPWFRAPVVFTFEAIKSGERYNLAVLHAPGPNYMSHDLLDDYLEVISDHSRTVEPVHLVVGDFNVNCDSGIRKGCQPITSIGTRRSPEKRSAAPRNTTLRRSGAPGDNRFDYGWLPLKVRHDVRCILIAHRCYETSDHCPVLFQVDTLLRRGRIAADRAQDTLTGPPLKRARVSGRWP